MSTALKITFYLFSSALFILFLTWNYFGPVNSQGQELTFVIPQEVGSFKLSNELYKQGLIKNKKAFEEEHQKEKNYIDIEDLIIEY